MKTMKKKLKSQKKIGLFSSPEMLERAMKSITMGGGPDDLPPVEKGKSHILQKGIQCGTCLKKVWSNYRHDFQSCLCPHGSGTQVFLDGGTGAMDYQRYGAEPKGSFTHITRQITLQQLRDEISGKETLIEMKRKRS